MGKLIHYEATFKWALEVGFSEREAKEIASANQRADTCKNGEQYNRGLHLNTNILALFGGQPTQEKLAAQYMEKALRDADLSALGYALHCIQDLIGHGIWPLYGYHWKGPWRIMLFGKTFKFSRYDPDTDLSGDRYAQLETATKDRLKSFINTTRAVTTEV